MKPSKPLAVAAIFCSLLACNRVTETAKTPPQSSTTTQNPVASPGNSTSMNPVTPPPQGIAGQATAVATPAVPVQLTEYAINMPEKFPAGRITMTITNSGKVAHGLAIEGDGVHIVVTDQIGPGDSSPFQLDLPAGKYTVYCPVDKHRGKGMTRAVTAE